MTTPRSRITQYAETSRQFTSQAGAIVLDANQHIGNGTFDAAQWAKSAHQLANLVLTTGLEMSSQMMPMPCLPGSSAEPELSDFIAVDPDNECKRTLSVDTSFVRDGEPSCVIPDPAIVFVPRMLRVYATWFRVGVVWPDLHSGTYRGRVRLTRIQTGAPTSVVMDAIVDL